MTYYLLILCGKKILLTFYKKTYDLPTYTNVIDLSINGQTAVHLKEMFNLNVINISLSKPLLIVKVEKPVDNYNYKEKWFSFNNAVKILEKHEFYEQLNTLLKQQEATLNINLQYGLRNNTVVNISELTDSERGLKCECICPGCGLELQARLGSGKRQRHFSHNNESCNIVNAQQTALHMMAKEILEQEKKILCPRIEVNKEDIINPQDYSEYERLPPTRVYKNECIVECKTVLLEKRISDIIPDVIMVFDYNKVCIIEIAVTHFIDEEKTDKIKKLGLPLLEIDLSSYQADVLDRETLRNVLLSNTNNKHWVYNPKNDEALEWAKNEYSKINKKLIEEERIKEKREIEETKRKEKLRQETRAYIENILQPMNYKSKLTELRDDDRFYKEYNQLTFVRKEGGNVPYFVDIPICGEMAFNCDRRIWQSMIFDKFIYNRNTDIQEKIIHIQKIMAWIYDHQKVFQVDRYMCSRVTVKIKNKECVKSFVYDVIKGYLSHLHFIGFISEVYSQEATILKSHTIKPPNEPNALKLYNILQSVDLYSPDINEIIIKAIELIENNDRPSSFLSSSNNHLRFNYDKYRAEKEEENKRKYLAGLNEITPIFNLNKNTPTYDSFNQRWLQCVECNELKRDCEMSTYGGINGINTGVCSVCDRNHKNK
ncbi:MAG: hypothetical protein AB9835_02045 [Eubacteriales bacterium]